MSKQFSNLEAWKNSKQLTLLVYQLIRGYPAREQFALTSQTTRAAVSIVANIAEGSSRSSTKDFCRFLEIAIGSAYELETLIEIAFNLGYITQVNKEIFDLSFEKTIKLIFGLKRKLNE